MLTLFHADFCPSHSCAQDLTTAGSWPTTKQAYASLWLDPVIPTPSLPSAPLATRPIAPQWMILCARLKTVNLRECHMVARARQFPIAPPTRGRFVSFF